MKRILGVMMTMGGLAVGCFAQPIVAPPPRVPEQRELRGEIPQARPIVAIALDAHGSCKFSTDGKKFRSFKKRAELPEGAIVRTGRTGSTDLFLKRMGTTIRIKPRSEIRLQRTELATTDERALLKGTVNLTKGRMLAVVHSNVPGSALEFQNAAGKSLSQSVAGGRYIISESAIEDAGPEKLPAGAEDAFSPQMSAAIREQMEFDEIQALAESWSEPTPGTN